MACRVDIVFSPDTDGDRLPDATEAWLGTDAGKPDTDGDHMPDGWEVYHELNPLDAGDAALDPDRDGSPNAHEHGADTDPHDPQSVLAITEFKGTNLPVSVVLTWNSVTSRIYEVEISSNLADTIWQKLPDTLPGNTSGQNSWTGAPAAGAEPALYRVRARKPE
jgi:hypothetical protein